MRPHLTALAVLLALAACSESDPVATVCTRADELSPCAEPSSAVRVATEVWEVTLRVTEQEEVEYRDGGVQCSFTRSTCSVLECGYARIPDFPPGEGWAIVVDGRGELVGYGEDTEEAAIAACADHFGVSAP